MKIFYYIVSRSRLVNTIATRKASCNITKVLSIYQWKAMLIYILTSVNLNTENAGEKKRLERNVNIIEQIE